MREMLSYIFLAVLGSFLGSFLNVVIYRLPRGESIVWPPSRCPHCGHRLRWYDLIPVISYLMLRGRCRYCGARISPRYPIIEGLTALWLPLAWWLTGQNIYPFLRVAVFGLFSIALGAIDLERMELPHALTIPLLYSLVSIDTVALLLRAKTGVTAVALADYISGAWLLLTFFLIIRLIYPRGMGGGDVVLGAGIGWLLGWKFSIAFLFVLFPVSAILMFPLLLRGIRQVPFGPFMIATALAIALFPWLGGVVLKVIGL